MLIHEDLPEFCRKAGTPFGVYGCLENAPEHGRLFGLIFHNVPLFSTVMELIPAVNDCVNIKYRFSKGKLCVRSGGFLVYFKREN
ncbi:MAG: hypothetical protein A2X80_13815 [Geobacteraceae bacterium GWB2_52_12]|nr:MAG: hypothetical protein A2X80_13815 [Geobacteraceae bacterium GWB2_52_12]